MNTPLKIYQSHIDSGKIKANPEQLIVVKALDNLYKTLMHERNVLAFAKRKLFKALGLSYAGVKGIYLWGDVGRGKTFLMDLFYQALPFPEKKRVHFYRFMQTVHQALQEKRGNNDPLQLIAQDFAKETQVLCFDEFYVEDIGDAMILAELFRHLFLQGVTLVATSNLAPTDLYANGLQRDKFLPAIALIQANTHVLALNHAEDYRLQFLRHHKLYHYPLDEASALQMAESFQSLSPELGEEQKILTIVNRPIPTVKCADSIVWFTFESLCTTHRSAQDYIEIARCFHTVLLSGVKKMGVEGEGIARRFMALVDEFYDRHVTLIVSAEVPTSALYHGKRYEIAFQRTLSRLTEMQSAAYLAKPHLA